MKRIAILGSTGSIGQSTLEVIRSLSSKEFCVTALSTNTNIGILERQINLFHPAVVCVTDRRAALALEPKIKGRGIRLFCAEEGLREMVQDKRIDEVVLAIGGSAALLPLLKAIDSGKDIALANKETLVVAGHLIMRKASRKGVRIKPVDSEQSAIWQCLDGRRENKFKRLYLTASGGPLRKKSKDELKEVSIAQVLRHPRWKMGRKITVDSATLMNKGLEVLEAMHLFNAGPDEIHVLIHPESIIHSMVEFMDGVVLAQLSVTDMRIPIQYALSYPKRMPSTLPSIDFYKLGSLNFQKPDLSRFPCLALAYRVARDGGTMPAVLNAANEVSVEEFLRGRLDFVAIPAVIEKVLSRHKKLTCPGLNQILEADAWARQEAYRVIDKQ